MCMAVSGIGIVICEGLGGATDILHYAFRYRNFQVFQIGKLINQNRMINQNQIFRFPCEIQRYRITVRSLMRCIAVAFL